MKTKWSQSKSSLGQVLFVVMILVAVMATIIAACLELTMHQSRMGWRSQFWNECIPVAEAGVEESLMNLNRNGLTNLTAAGWTATNNGAYVRRMVTSSNEAIYHAFVSGTSNIATNVVTGTVMLPTALGGGKVSRTVRVVATNQPLFTKEIWTDEGVDLNGHSVDCGCNDHPMTGGLLSLNVDATIVIPDLEVIDICLQATVLNGTNLAAANAEVLAEGLINANATASAAVYMTPVEPPYSTAPLPDINYSYGGTTYVYHANGNVMMNTISLSGNERMLITGDTTLYVLGDITLRGNSSIYVAPGATLRLYARGATTRIENHSTISVNDPLRFQYYGLPSNTGIIVDGAATANGLIYAPSASIDLGTSVQTGGVVILGVRVGGSLRLNFNGAIISRKVTFTTDTIFRIPITVTTAGPTRGFVVKSWEEI